MCKTVEYVIDHSQGQILIFEKLGRITGYAQINVFREKRLITKVFKVFFPEILM